MNYENYGCEYLDLESYSPLADPWGLSFFLSMDFVSRTVDSKYSDEISLTHKNKIEYLQKSIAQHGLTRSGILLCDSTRVKLQDGNHMFLACKNLGYKKFPVVIKVIDGKLNAGVPYKELIYELLQIRDIHERNISIL